MDSKKRFKYGSYAFLMTVVVLCIFIILALILNKQNWKIDATSNKIYSLSDQTKKVLANIKEDIKIYVFRIKDIEDINVNEMLDRYRKINPRIKIEQFEASKHPDKVRKYSEMTINPNSPIAVVFETGKRTKVINIYEMYTTDHETQSQIFVGEQKFTNAIRYVTQEKSPTIYILQGHKEPTMDMMPLAIDMIRQQNYNVKTLNLLTQKNIPNDADVIIDVAPQSAFLPEEITVLEKYFDNGGKGAFFIDPSKEGSRYTANLKTMIKKWGVELNDNIVIEANPDYYNEDKTLIVPKIQNHEITNPLEGSGLNVLVGVSRSLTITKVNGYTVESLMKSSSNSWGKKDIEKTLEKEAGDLLGPLDLAAVISRKTGGPNNAEMKVFVSGSSLLVNDYILENGGNQELLLNVIGWLKGATEEITIRPKQTLTSFLNMTSSERMYVKILVMVIIPVIALGTGLIVWARRRHL